MPASALALALLLAFSSTRIALGGTPGGAFPGLSLSRGRILFLVSSFLLCFSFFALFRMSYWISKSVAGRGAKGVVNPFKIISKIIRKIDFVGNPTGAPWNPINKGALARSLRNHRNYCQNIRKSQPRPFMYLIGFLDYLRMLDLLELFNFLLDPTY